MNYIVSVGGKMIVMTLAAITAAILVGLIASRTSAKIGRDLRARLYEKTLSFSGTEIDRFTTASLITRNTNDVQQVQTTAVMLLRITLFAPVMGIGGVIMVLSTRTGMAWIVLVAVMLVLILVVLLFVFAMPKFKIMQKLVDALNLVSREILTGISVIRAFGRESYEERRFDSANSKLTETQLFTGRAMSVMMPSMTVIMNVIVVLIVWFGARGIDSGNLLVGDMMAFITYTMQIVMSFMMISMVSVMLPRANVAAERIEEVLEAQSSVRDEVGVADKHEAADTMDKPGAIGETGAIDETGTIGESDATGEVGAIGESGLSGNIVFSNVTFRYPGAEGDALRNISFTASPGETVAIIGGTGSGKSTLVNLLPRLYDVVDGSITIDGTDIRKMSQRALRKAIGFVPQRAVLFSGDIESNIRFGDASITESDMLSAAEIAQATEFINEREGTWKSRIAQMGTNVSGGQKQRLAIARAIAKKPAILVFDDSFSALDYKTDAALRRALKDTSSRSTVIIVAQRISTVLYADKILVLNNGEIVGEGTHRELLRGCETYIEIAGSQLSERELSLVG